MGSGSVVGVRITAVGRMSSVSTHSFNRTVIHFGGERSSPTRCVLRSYDEVQLVL
jgi:hypothetical protein